MLSFKIKLSIATTLLILIFVLAGCGNKSTPSDLNLASIDFLRGDITLCGDAFGELKYSLSCSYETRESFDLAMTLLHSFQYAEAEKAFVKVMDQDPNCAMAYWGVAMSIYHAAWFPPTDEELTKGLKIIQEAKKLDMEEKQRDYLNAIGAFYTDWENVDHQTRAKRFEKKMEEMHSKYPDDVEAAVFYSLALYSTRDRTSDDHTNEQKAGKILENLFASNPNHPGIAHYIIHNYDNPALAHKALETARKYAKIAPASAHAQHMPSHIFTRLGLWEESIQSNIASAESARCYAAAEGIEGGYFEEYHAIDYLVYAYLQKGDNANAKAEYERVRNIESFYPSMLPAIIYPIAVMPARLALENKNWEQAANLELQEMELDWEKFPWQKATHHFAKALGYCHTGQFAPAKREIDLIRAQNQKLVAQDNPALTIQIKQVETQAKTAEAWLKFKSGHQEEGLAMMHEAAEKERNTMTHPVTPGDLRPAVELLGDMLLEMEQYEKALEVYEENLKDRPHRFNGVYGAAVASSQLGNDQKAETYYGALLELTSGVDSDRPELEEAREFLKSKAI